MKIKQTIFRTIAVSSLIISTLGSVLFMSQPALAYKCAGDQTVWEYHASDGLCWQRYYDGAGQKPGTGKVNPDGSITYTCPDGKVVQNQNDNCLIWDGKHYTESHNDKVVYDNGQPIPEDPANLKCIDKSGSTTYTYIPASKNPPDGAGCYAIQADGSIPCGQHKHQQTNSSGKVTSTTCQNDDVYQSPVKPDTSIHDDAVKACTDAGGSQQDCEAIGKAIDQCTSSATSKGASALDCQNLGSVMQACLKSGKSAADCQNEAQAMIDNCNRLVSNNTYKTTADCVKASATQAYGCPNGQSVVDYSTNGCSDGSTAAQVGSSGASTTPQASPGTCGKVKTLILPCKGQGLEAIASVLKFVLTILSVGVGIVAVGGIVYGAALYAGARDNGGQVQQGITIIRDVVIGVLMYVFMVAILSWLVPGIWSS